MVSPKMFSVCKIMNLNPNMIEFMSSSLFVYELKSKRMATIHLTFEHGEPRTLELIGCTEGPATFRELLEALNSRMDNVGDKVAMICKEKLPGAKKVGELGTAHLTESFDSATLREIAKTFTTIVDNCFSEGTADLSGSMLGDRIKAYQKGHYTKANVWDEAAALQIYRGGELLDPGVNYFVLMLDQLGLPTSYSCEGHPGGFYVTFSAPYEEALAISKVGYFTIEIMGKDYWAMRQTHRPDDANKTDGMRWAAAAWEEKLGPLDFSKVQIST